MDAVVLIGSFLLLMIIGVFAALVAPRWVAASPCGCSWRWPAVGEIRIG